MRGTVRELAPAKLHVADAERGAAHGEVGLPRAAGQAAGPQHVDVVRLPVRATGQAERRPERGEGPQPAADQALLHHRHRAAVQPLAFKKPGALVERDR